MSGLLCMAQTAKPWAGQEMSLVIHYGFERLDRAMDQENV